MATNLGAQASDSLLLRSEMRPRMAKADLRKAEAGEWKANVGRAIQRAYLLCGWTLKEFADQVKRDERQLARWISGAERPQFDTLFAVVALRQALIIALAELAGAGVEVETTVRVVRRREVA